MSCQYLKSAKPIDWWHRLRCAECRAARFMDRRIETGVRRMKAEPAPADGLMLTIASLGVMLTPKEQRKVQRKQRLRRFSRNAVFVTTPLALAGYGWYLHLVADPDVSVPSPWMPPNNAYTFYVAAGNVEIDSNFVDHALRPAPLAAHKDVKAEIMALSKNASGKNDKPDPNHVYTLEEQEALVKKNATTLCLLRQGFAYPYQEPPARSFSALFPHYAHYRALARLLALEAQTKAERKDWGGAFNSSLDAMQLGATSTHGAPFIGKLVGIACEAIGRRPLWKLVDKLDAAQAQAARKRLETILAKDKETQYADTLQEEEWMQTAGLQEAFREVNWFTGWLNMTGAGSDPNESEIEKQWKQITFAAQMLRYSKSDILNNYKRAMDQNIANARQPYAAHPAEAPIPEDPINRMLFPVFSQGRFSEVNTQTANELLRTMLALRAYHEEYRRYPQTLAELTPRYLTEAPKDPFGLEALLHYRQEGAGYILYSVGPDGVDNGGAPIDDKTKAAPSNPESRARYLPMPTSVGDIVAGVNY